MVKINTIINKINSNLRYYVNSHNAVTDGFIQSLRNIFINDSDYGISQFQLLFKLISNADFFIEDENISNLIIYNTDLTNSVENLNITITLLNTVNEIYTTNRSSTNPKVVAFEEIIRTPNFINDDYIIKLDSELETLRGIISNLSTKIIDLRSQLETINIKMDFHSFELKRMGDWGQIQQAKRLGNTAIITMDRLCAAWAILQGVPVFFSFRNNFYYYPGRDENNVDNNTKKFFAILDTLHDFCKSTQGRIQISLGLLAHCFRQGTIIDEQIRIDTLNGEPSLYQTYGLNRNNKLTNIFNAIINNREIHNTYKDEFMSDFEGTVLDNVLGLYPTSVPLDNANINNYEEIKGFIKDTNITNFIWDMWGNQPIIGSVFRDMSTRIDDYKFYGCPAVWWDAASKVTNTELDIELVNTFNNSLSGLFNEEMIHYNIENSIKTNRGNVTGSIEHTGSSVSALLNRGNCPDQSNYNIIPAGRIFSFVQIGGDDDDDDDDDEIIGSVIDRRRVFFEEYNKIISSLEILKEQLNKLREIFSIIQEEGKNITPPRTPETSQGPPRSTGTPGTLPESSSEQPDQYGTPGGNRIYVGGIINIADHITKLEISKRGGLKKLEHFMLNNYFTD